MARKRAAPIIITRVNEDGEATTYRRNRKRYAYGRGSVYQRSRDGKWVAALPLGRGKTKSWVCRSEAEAEAKLQDALEHAGQGVLPDTQRTTLGEWLAHWLETRVQNHKAPKTVESYEYLIRVHLKPSALAALPLGDARTEHIAAFLAQKAKERSQRNGRA